jgi:hypothetical protein
MRTRTGQSDLWAVDIFAAVFILACFLPKKRMSSLQTT